MGLLDQLAGGLLGQGGKAAGGSLGALLGGLASDPSAGGDVLAALLPVVLELLQGRGEAAAGGAGLSGILDKLRAGGLGQQVDSWVGTGPNLPVAAEQLSQALGKEQISQLAGKAGLPEAQVGTGLAALLPELINQLTSGGQVPGGTALNDALAGLRRSIGV